MPSATRRVPLIERVSHLFIKVPKKKAANENAFLSLPPAGIIDVATCFNFVVASLWNRGLAFE